MNFSNEKMNYGQTFSVSDQPTWRSVHFPTQVTGVLTITRPNYNISPETADGVSVIISGVRWR